MKADRPSQHVNCSLPGCRCGMPRRDFLWLAGVAGGAAALGEAFATDGPFTAGGFDKLVPRNKRLRPEWIASLTRRGKPQVYRGQELDFIGMPVGGIACGQLYLGGDGRLWYWDIFRSATSTDGKNRIWEGHKYKDPVRPGQAVEHGFALRIVADGVTSIRTLDRRGFKDVSFRGEYPIGCVTYRDDASPVQADLEAFSPFIPLNVDDSSIPATILEFTVRSSSAQSVEVTLAGWLENAVCHGVQAGGVTPLGPLPFFIDFLKTVELFKPWVEGVSFNVQEQPCAGEGRGVGDAFSFGAGGAHAVRAY